MLQIYASEITLIHKIQKMRNYNRIQRSQFNYKVTPIWCSFSKWYDRNITYRDKKVLDFGGNIHSAAFRKYLQDNHGKDWGYFGFDIDEEAVTWLKKKKYYIEFPSFDKKKFDIINASQVYEHLDRKKRAEFLKNAFQQLKPNGLLTLDFPFIYNLNLIDFFIDMTHIPVAFRQEASFINTFGFSTKLYIGGWTAPYKSIITNLIHIIANLILGYYPFHVILVIAKKK